MKDNNLENEEKKLQNSWLIIQKTRFALASCIPLQKTKNIKTLKGDWEIGHFYFKNYMFEEKCENIISNKANPAKIE